MCFGLQDMRELDPAEAFASDARLNRSAAQVHRRDHYRIPLRWLSWWLSTSSEEMIAAAPLRSRGRYLGDGKDAKAEFERSPQLSEGDRRPENGSSFKRSSMPREQDRQSCFWAHLLFLRNCAAAGAGVVGCSENDGYANTAGDAVAVTAAASSILAASSPSLCLATAASSSS